MNLVYAGEDLPKEITKSVFLAGPTPRDDATDSWRPDAVKIFENAGFDGTLFIPEAEDGNFPDYDDQIGWESECLNVADIILFWVPRDLDDMPAFTTNVEFGRWFTSGKIVFGAPKEAPKNGYLFHKAKEHDVPTFTDLDGMIKHVIQELGDGAERTGGERFVPLLIWDTPAFQSWYNAQKEAGNRLDGAKLLYTFIMPKMKLVFLWVLQVDVYITSEDRHKTNEFVLARTDISAVVVYRPANDAMNTELALVREFRSPASTEDGFIWEIPGGSSFKPDEDPTEVAASEVEEEIGLKIDPEKVQYVGKRQLAGTLSSHKCHLYSVELDDDQMAELKEIADKKEPMGNEEDTERTYLEIKTLQEVLDNELVDWSNLGMILEVVWA